MTDNDTRREEDAKPDDASPQDTAAETPADPGPAATPGKRSGKKKGQGQPEGADYEPDKDPYIQALQDVPRMSAMEGDTDAKGRPYTPPPPTISRIGGLLQGCGGVLLTILAVPMVLAALWFGFYLWGPGLLLGGGLVLIAGTAGVWTGRVTPLIVALVVVAGLAGVGYAWGSFVPAAAALSPIGQLGMLMAPGALLVALVLVVSFGVNLITLFYWRRLKQPLRQRHVAVWAIGVPVLIAAALILHFTQDQQRKTWLEDQLDAWTDEAAAAGVDSLELGANANVTLGYSFTTVEEDDNSRLDVRLAELEAALASGVEIVRMSASGDLLLEVEEPRLFTIDEDASADEQAEQAEENAARIARQRAYEDEYLSRLEESGAALYLSDSQYSPYLLVWANDEDAIEWDAFTALHADRVRHYAAEFQPARYGIVTEPSAYEQFSGLAGGKDEIKLERWLAHTEDLIEIVREESPDTLIGVTVALQSDFDLDYYERALELDGIDFISFRIFQPGALTRLEEELEERGHPADFDKELWLSETWYGYCLAPQRSMELDGLWLDVVTAFAAKEGISGVLVADFGCFVQKGGTLFQDYEPGDDRTEVWEAWQDVVALWDS